MKIFVINTTILLLLFHIFFNGCFKKDENDSAVCERLQMMSEKCENDILEIFRKFVSENEKNGQSDFDYILIESRIKKKISQKEGMKQCERYRGSLKAEDKLRFDNIKSCSKKNSCSEFARCIITL